MEFSDTNLSSENLADVLTECFTFTLMTTEAFSKNTGKVFRA